VSRDDAGRDDAGQENADRDDAGQVEERLSAWLASELPKDADVRITGLRRASAGMSRENWIFEASWSVDGERVTEALIMRRDPVGSVLDTDRAVEFAVLKALESTAVPAPRVRWLDADGRWLGRPSIVMVLAEGICDYFVLNGEKPLATRVALAEHFCDLLIAIHQVDWRAGGLESVLADPGSSASLTALDLWEGVLRRHQLEPLPELDLVAGWLRAHAPAAATTALIHGDFKPGNALLRGDEVSVVLDWETAHLGDPVEDLGWVTNPLRRREHQIPEAWTAASLLSRYQAKTGMAVDDEALRWWRVLANYKLAVIGLTGVAAFVDGRYDRAHQVPGPLFAVMFDLIGV
jgi:aminoglycoside phosphotransferase (APT) family kinase protein